MVAAPSVYVRFYQPEKIKTSPTAWQVKSAMMLPSRVDYTTTVKLSFSFCSIINRKLDKKAVSA
jgi:hypothetical protein